MGAQAQGKCCLADTPLHNVRSFFPASAMMGSLVRPQESHLNVDQALTAEAQDEPTVQEHCHITACFIRLNERRCTELTW